MGDEGEKLYKAEYAKSNRAACKKCSRSIEKDDLRLAIMVRSSFHDGKIPNWHHFDCFFSRARVKMDTDIAGLNQLRWEDQERVRKRIAGGSEVEAEEEAGACSSSKSKSSKRKKKAASDEYSDFSIEYAKSNRSGCRSCEEKIEKESIRIGKMDYESESSLKFGPHPNWYHADCFVSQREELQFGASFDIQQVKGFKDLTAEDRKSLVSKLPHTKADRKRKPDAEDGGPAAKKSDSATSNSQVKSESGEDKQKLKEQAELLWKFRDSLQRDVDKSALRGLLEYNEQDVPAGESGILDALADCLVFGSLVRCPTCINGQIYFSSSGVYKCLGHTDWSKCMYMTPKPARLPFRIPEEYQDVTLLKKYKYVKRDRYIPQAVIDSVTRTFVSAEIPGTSQTLGAGEANNNSNSSANAFNSSKPFTNLKFAFSSQLSRTQAALLKDSIAALGGRTDIPDYHVLITGDICEQTDEKHEAARGKAKAKSKSDKKLTEARAKNAFICAVALIDEVSRITSNPNAASGVAEDATAAPVAKRLSMKRTKSDAVGKVKDDAVTKPKVEAGADQPTSTGFTVDTLLDTFERHRLVAECGLRNALRDAILGSSRNVVLKSGAAKSGSGVSKSGKSMYTKSVPDKLKLVVKDGAAVDPDSELESVAHVYKHKSRLYTAVLNKVDIVRDRNSYYKLQLLESDSKNRWWVFRSWGRIGTTIGGNKIEQYRSLDNAIASFDERYEEMTGNEFGAAEFVKKPGAYFPLDIDYGGASDSGPQRLDPKLSQSKLSLPVRELICTIFDVEAMRRTMLEFELDLRKMPLGKLSRKHITSAYTVLSQLGTLCEQHAPIERLVEASTRFYTMIPHDFGVERPPIINTLDAVKAKISMLDNLLEIEMAYSLMQAVPSGSTNAEPDPIDMHYSKLKCNIQPITRDSDTFAMIERYVRGTHAATHTSYDLAVEDLFEVARDGESDHFESFNELRRMLLWHGSRTTNYVGILSQGLRIAPPEAPVTGYMFGKGIYFADMVSKSANYCYPSKEKNTGYLLLCEVAVGEPWELTSAQNVNKLPKGKHSVKGIGATAPDPAMAERIEDGIEVPLGNGIPNKDVERLGGRSDLLYNEYIVYDTAQVRIRYLLKLRFNFKY